MMFKGLQAEQVNSIHTLFLFLHQLKVIGTVHTKTMRTSSHTSNLYDIVFCNYDHTTKNVINPHEKLKVFFGRKQAITQYEDIIKKVR